jgi:hypothetical protein
VILNHAVTWDGGEILWYELQDVGHDTKIDIERAQGCGGLFCLKGGQLPQGNARLLCGTTERIGLGASLLWSAEHACDRIAALHESLEDCLAEILLSNDRDAHSSLSAIRTESHKSGCRSGLRPSLRVGLGTQVGGVIVPFLKARLPESYLGCWFSNLLINKIFIKDPIRVVLA